MIEILKEPWPWYVAGPLITLTMFLLLWFGKRFGVSSNLQHMCAIGGARKLSSYFDCDWRKNIWNLVFLGGMIAGGFIASTYLMEDHTVAIAASTIENLQSMGMENAGQEFIPFFAILLGKSRLTTRVDHDPAGRIPCRIRNTVCRWVHIWTRH